MPVLTMEKKIDSDTQSTAFDRWFAGSKVVDPHGKPLRMYHGAPLHKSLDGTKVLGDFTVFDRNAAADFKGHAHDQSMDRVGSFFSDQPGDDGAAMYSGKTGAIYPVYLSIKKPWVVTFDAFLKKGQELDGWEAKNKESKTKTGWTRAAGAFNVAPLRAWLKSKGYDGIQFKGVVDSRTQKVWVALEPSQIKSATGNRGTFSADSPDIRESSVQWTDTLSLTEARAKPTYFDLNRMKPEERENFDRWFAGSVLKDRKGNPMILYHGSKSKVHYSNLHDGSHKFRFFTDRTAIANAYADVNVSNNGGVGVKTYPVFIRMRQPLVVDAKGRTYEFIWYDGKFFDIDQLAVVANEKGHDGLIVHNVKDIGGKNRKRDILQSQYVTFSGDQIKSATGNKGTYNSESPHLAERVKWVDTLSLNEAEDKPVYFDLKRMKDAERKNFERWFAGSTLKDASGNPMILYHGNRSTLHRANLHHTPGKYRFFTHQSPIAGGYAWPWAPNKTKSPHDGQHAKIYPVFIKMVNPLVVDAQGHSWREIPFEGFNSYIETIAMLAEGKGHDGLIVTNVNDTGTGLKTTLLQTQYVTFKGTQIKSVTGNNGAYNPDSPDISESADITNTLAFKSWFKQSKVVDRQGKPLRVYHGTPTPGFSAFKAGWDDGLHFSPLTDIANSYARRKGAIYPVYVSMQNPYYPKPGSYDGVDGAIRAAKNLGHDGVIFRDDEDIQQVIALSSKQVKSATGNKGTFNPDSDDIGESKVKWTDTLSIDEEQPQKNRRLALRDFHKSKGVTFKDYTIDRGGAHTPAGPESGSPAYDVTLNGTYPEDFYSHNGLRYYGSGQHRLDRSAYDLIEKVSGRANAPVVVYRAVEKDGNSKIIPGDWVTIVRAYAKEHGDGALGGNYKIISKTVYARDIWTSGDSMLEWGYHPQPELPRIPTTRKPPSESIDTLSIDERSQMKMWKEPGVDQMSDGEYRRFKQWFGKSKVVDSYGEPLRVFHGTGHYAGQQRKFNTFALGDSSAFFFTPDTENANTYTRSGTGNVLPVYLRMLKPMVVDAQNKDWNEIEWEGETTSTDLISMEARSRGYDGVIFKRVVDSGNFSYKKPGTVYAVFEPTQIKSAIGNKGTYNNDDPDIRESTDITNTPAFKSWFKKSKVVDQQGKPLVVYKGMYPYDWTKENGQGRGPEITSINRTSEFPAFNRDEPGVKIAGFFGDKETANHFASIHGSSAAVFPVYLSIQKPYVIDAKGKPAGNAQFFEEGRAFRDAIRSGKYDGVIIKNTSDENTIFVALRPSQIKSAIGNKGTFNAKSDDLRESSVEWIDTKSLTERSPYGSPEKQAQYLDLLQLPVKHRMNLKRWLAGSKLVNDKGNPLMLYRGTLRSEPYTDMHANTDKARFFTTDTGIASAYAKRGDSTPASSVRPHVYPVFVRMKNPLIVDAKGKDYIIIPFEGAKVSPEALVKVAKERGHDGLIIQNVKDIAHYGTKIQTQYATFSSDQIKSAIGNKGTYNSEDPDISESRVRWIDTKSLTEKRIITGRERQAQYFDLLRLPPKQRMNLKRWLAGSTLVNDKGNPLVLYHGTVRPEHHIAMHAVKGKMRFFTTDPDIANHYTEFPPFGHASQQRPRVYPVFIKLKNPMVVDALENRWTHIPFEGGYCAIETLAGVVRSRGHDGLIVKNVRDKSVRGTIMQTQYITFDGAQIKSAIGNSGSYSDTDPALAESRVQWVDTLAEVNLLPNNYHTPQNATATPKDALNIKPLIAGEGPVQGKYLSDFFDPIRDALDALIPTRKQSTLSEALYWHTKNGRSIRLATHARVYSFPDSGVNIVLEKGFNSRSNEDYSNVIIQSGQSIDPHAIAKWAKATNEKLAPVDVQAVQKSLDDRARRLQLWQDITNEIHARYELVRDWPIELRSISFGKLRTHAKKLGFTNLGINDRHKFGLMRYILRHYALNHEPDTDSVKVKVDAAIQKLSQIAESRVQWIDTQSLTEKKINTGREKTPRYFDLMQLPIAARTNLKKWIAGSKLVNANGNPLMLYHGTVRPEPHINMHATSDKFRFFTTDPGITTEYANPGVFGLAGNKRPRVYPVFIKMLKPLTVDAEGAVWAEIPFAGKIWKPEELAKYAREEGYDGLIVQNVLDRAARSTLIQTQYVTFTGNQIKSAIGNSGNYSPDSPNLHESNDALMKWFAGSKVRDAQGRPLRVYHGLTGFKTSTGNDGFTVFRPSADGIYFTDSPTNAGSYATKGAARIMPCYLRIKKPLTVDAKGSQWDAVQWQGETWTPHALLKRAKEAGRDGLIIKNVVDGAKRDTSGTATTYVVTHPRQIKSATGNSGKYDSRSLDIAEGNVARFVDVPDSELNSREWASKQLPGRSAKFIAPKYARSFDVRKMSKEAQQSFKAWFRESVVCDAKGNPLIVYHGTNATKDFKQFKPLKKMKGYTDFHGSFFTDHTENANSYADYYQDGAPRARIIPVFLRLERPLIIDAKGANYTEIKIGNAFQHSDVIVHLAYQSQEYDGVIIRNVCDPHNSKGFQGSQTTYVAWSPKQIKSAIGNKGTYDIGSKNMDETHVKWTDTLSLTEAESKPEYFYLSKMKPDERKNFERWFKGSKLCDRSGNPMILYHGTARPLPYDDDNMHMNPDSIRFFSHQTLIANYYAHDLVLGDFNDGAKIYPVFIRMVNPLIIDAKGADFHEIKWKDGVWTIDELAADTKNSPHDGLIVKNVKDETLAGPRPQTTYITFSASQIKSAIGNSGRYRGTSMRESQVKWVDTLSENAPELPLRNGFRVINTRTTHPDTVVQYVRAGDDVLIDTPQEKGDRPVEVESVRRSVRRGERWGSDTDHRDTTTHTKTEMVIVTLWTHNAGLQRMKYTIKGPTTTIKNESRVRWIPRNENTDRVVVNVPRGSHSIPRMNMPQIKSTRVGEFRDWLKTEHNIESRETSERADKLKATQADINASKVQAMMGTERAQVAKPLLISSDRYVLDGHHRWLAQLQDRPDSKVPVCVIDTPMSNLLKIAGDWSGTLYKSIDESVKFDNVSIMYPKDFTYSDDPDDFVYHVTTVGAATNIAHEGFKKKPATFKAGIYPNYSRGYVFFTEHDGVQFWIDRVEEQLEANYDDPPSIAIIRVPRTAISDKLEPDTIGSKDSRRKCWKMKV